MDEDRIVIPLEDVEIVDAAEYKEELSQHFDSVPELAKPLLKQAKSVFSKIEKALYTAPAFINAVKAAIPDVTLQAVLTDEQKKQIAKGALKLMTKKDGSLMANLINPETKKIVTTIPLKSVQMAPEMTQASLFVTLSNYTKNAQKYLDSTPVIRGINGTELVDLILKYYEDLSEKYKKMIPLKRVYIPVPKEE